MQHIHWETSVLMINHIQCNTYARCNAPYRSPQMAQATYTNHLIRPQAIMGFTCDPAHFNETSTHSKPYPISHRHHMIRAYVPIYFCPAKPPEMQPHFRRGSDDHRDTAKAGKTCFGSKALTSTCSSQCIGCPALLIR